MKTENLNVRFGELTITKADLERLGPRLAQAFVSTSFVSQEIREFIRLVDGAIVENDTEQKVQLMETTQRGILLRTLAMKVENFLAIWANLLSKATIHKEDEFGILKELYDHHKKNFASLDGHPGKEIASHIRNRITAHADLVGIQTAIEMTMENWTHSILYCEDQGNSFFAIGEDIVFGLGLRHENGRKNGSPEKRYTPSEGLDRLGIWQGYVILAAKICLDYHFDLIHDVPPKALGKESVTWVHTSIPNGRHSTLEDFRLPVYSHRPVSE
ncbi:hypothetical protein [Pseudophaeobacter sp. EL27]|uniref:hypothetical protein n=1 Tax=Pseudophaeobacter sp. EL27 TaxID=2107580 RepID=UPI0013C4F46F|nr:hypothetical protein [Pseudophaeobacter sp. EL27]